MLNYVWFFLAAVFEIAGCYGFWMWLRQGKSVWWVVPAIVSLTVFAVLLTKVEKWAVWVMQLRLVFIPEKILVLWVMAGL